jgi:hypothetical protein
MPDNKDTNKPTPPKQTPTPTPKPLPPRPPNRLLKEGKEPPRPKGK